MERWRNKVAVVTGASSGIGAACARALVGAGLIVVGLARRQDRVEQLRATLMHNDAQHKHSTHSTHSTENNNTTKLHALKCDISVEVQVLAAFDWVKHHLGGVDVLVNNAGIIATTELSGHDNTQAIRNTIETNLMGSIYCIREAFQSMQQQEQRDNNSQGHVIIVNSIAGYQVPNLGPQLPSLNVYPATKFALRAMNEIYRQEFQRHHTNVRVSTISPGMVDTEILPQGVQAAIKGANMPMLSPQDIADSVLWTIATPPNVQVHNIIIKPMGEKF